MKTTEFIVETSMIAQEADTMHADHEVQMARADCYNAAKYAIELHKLLKNMSESQGLDGWVSEKITLANDYLHMVHEYLKYENAAQPDMMEFAESAADYAVDQLLAEERTETKNDKGEVTSWKDESDWRKSNKDKSGRGKVTNLSDKARRETERLAKKGVAEGLGKDIKRLATGQDVKSRAGQEIAKSQDASMKGDTKTSKKHFDRYDKLDQLANKEQGVSGGKKIAEMATGGGSSSAGVATSMGGPAHKPTSGVPKKLGNAAKMKKVTVGKGVY